MTNHSQTIFYTARTGSSRLPGKMLKKIKEKTIAELGLERLSFNGKERQIILCTTFLEEDNILCDIAQKMNVKFYRGPVNDVLERYHGAAKQYNVDFFVAVDGDDLFVENLYIDKIFEEFQKTNADYIFLEGLPLGTFGFGVKTDALKKVCAIKDDRDTEGWGRYFTQTGMFKVVKIEASKEHSRPEYRLTLDYQEDFELITLIYKNIYQEGKYFNIDTLFEFLRKNPKIAELNWNRKEEYAKRFREKYSKIYLKNNI